AAVSAEACALSSYGARVEGTLGNARALGIREALTGPMTRGDVGTPGAHLAALAAPAPGVLPLYVAAPRRPPGAPPAPPPCPRPGRPAALCGCGAPRDRSGARAWRAGTGDRLADA